MPTPARSAAACANCRTNWAFGSPVYVLFTKADLIAGFVEFFDNMGREEREQVWGVTFPLDDGAMRTASVAGFSGAFDALLARLNDRMLERVHQEPDLQRRRLIYGFPQQIASLRDVAAEFLTECFRPSRLEARPLLRGVYFTSGTQDGTPIDRLLGHHGREFGLPRQAVPAFSGSGRSYFLARLIKEVVFGEAGAGWAGRRRWNDAPVDQPIRLRRMRAVILLLLAGSLGRELLRQPRADRGGACRRRGLQLARSPSWRKRGPTDTDLGRRRPAARYAARDPWRL